MRRLTLLTLLVCGPALSAPPTFTAIAPRSAQRGKQLTVIVTGTNLTPATRLVLPFAAEQKAIPEPKPNPAQLRLELTVDAKVPPGVYPVRLLGEDGLSSLALFRVDNLVIGAEVEDNSSFDKAQKLPGWPIAVEGQCAGGDVDFFRIAAKKGQRVTIEVESARLGSAVLPQLRVTDDKKRFVAADDSQSLQGDARVSFSANDGEYVIELSDSRYRGGTPPFYRLRITDQDAFDEVFPLGGRRGEQTAFLLRGGTLAKPFAFTDKLTDGHFSGLSLLSREGGQATRLAVGDLPEIVRKDEEPSALVVKPPLVINGRLAKESQTDQVRFSVMPGSRWRFAVAAESLGSRLDGVLQVSDEKGRPLLNADDADLTPLQVRTADPSGELTVPADVKELTVSLRDQRERGGVGFGYRLAIEPAADDYSLSLPVSELNVPRGGAMALPVTVTRRGYAGPIAVNIDGLPAGLRVKGGRIPADAVAGVLTIEAAEAAGEPADVSVEGKATIDGKEAKRAATQRLLLARESGAAGVYSLPKLAIARTSAAPYSLTPPATVTLVKGYVSEFPVKLTRGKGQEKLAITLTALPPGPAAGPTGFTLRPTPAATAAEVSLGVTAGVGAPEGEADLAVLAQARVGNDDIRLSTPAIAAVIKPPFVVTLDGPVELKAGQTIKLTGKVAREAVCKEPVRLALAGLPAGVTLTPPQPIAPGQATFALELKVGPKPEKLAGKLTLTASATVNGQNYAQRPIEVGVK